MGVGSLFLRDHLIVCSASADPTLRVDLVEWASPVNKEFDCEEYSKILTAKISQISVHFLWFTEAVVRSCSSK